jgi:MFS family permease
MPTRSMDLQTEPYKASSESQKNVSLLKQHDVKTHGSTRSEPFVLDARENGSCAAKSKTDRDTSPSCSWHSVRILLSILIASTVPGPLFGGFSIAYSSPLLDEMTRNLNSTHWSEGFDNCIYQSLIGPSVLIGGAIGGVSTFPFITMFGLVFPMFAVTLIAIAGWSMIGVSWFVSSPSLFRGLILAGRFVTGLGLGSSGSLRSVYVGEVSSNKCRSPMMAIGFCLYAFGAMMAYLLGAFFPYWISAFICAGIAAIILPFIAVLPESPLRTCNVTTNAKVMMKNLKELLSTKCLFRGMTFGPFLRRVLMVEVIFISQVFLGYILLAQYIGPILNVAGANHWNIPHGVLQTITVGSSDLIGSFVAVFVASKLGHITSCFIGVIVVCLGHVGNGVYFLLTGGISPHESQLSTMAELANTSVSEICIFKPHINPDIGEMYSPLTLLSTSLVVLAYGIFWVPQQYIIAVELFTDETRGLGLGICTSSMYIYYIISSFLFPILERLIGTSLCFFILAAISGLMALLIPTLVPETKGRPMGERGDKFTPKQNWLELYTSIKNVIMILICCCKHKG